MLKGCLPAKVILCLVLCAWSSVAQSSSRGVSKPVIEEVVVTAQKREQNLQVVPIAVTVVNGDELPLQGVNDLLGISYQVPSLNITQSGSVLTTTFAVRGLGTSASNAGLEPSVGLFIDGVYQSRPAQVMGDLLDIERIEILRGPQSTLFGKNTSAGVVSIITRAPEKQATYEINAGLANYNDQKIQAVATGPISDQLFFRVSSSYHKRDGFYDNAFDGGHINNKDRWAQRGQLLFEPNEELSLRFSVETEAVNELCCAAPFVVHRSENQTLLAVLGGWPINSDPYARVVAVDNEPVYRHEQSRYVMMIDWEPGEIAFSSKSAYQNFDLRAGIDSDFTDLDLSSGESIRTDDMGMVSQEFRLSSNSLRTVQWQGGLYYFSQKYEHEQSALHGSEMRTFIDTLTTIMMGGNPMIEPSPVTFLEQSVLGLPVNTFFSEGDGVQRAVYDLDAKSIAIYGQVDWSVTKKVTLSSGLRFTREEKIIDGSYSIDDPFSALDMSPSSMIARVYPAATALRALQFYPSVSDFKDSRKDNNISGNISLTYHFNNQVNSYSSYRRGFKSGGFQVTSFIPENGVEFDEETVDAIELGVKMQSSDNQLRANIAIFDQQVDGYQVFIIENNSSVVSNASDVAIRGVEFEGQWMVSRQLWLDTSVTWLDAIFDRFRNGPCTVLEPASQCDLTDKPLSNVPDWTISTSLHYVFTVSRYLVSSRLNYSYRGGRYASPDLDPLSRQNAAQLINANVGVADVGAGWSFSFWGRNLGNEEYADIMFDSVVLLGDHNGYPGDPRTYGATLGLSF